MREIKITILSKEDCHFCDVAKALFKQLKVEFNVNIEIIDINTPEGKTQAEKFGLGLLFLPGILINDHPFSYGRPSEKKLRKELMRLINE
ncbi:glutaredoxin family protein [Haloplasma contractile]|uniref:Glutaredoxin 2 protein n=1 Tax=Haloplasma contractile SSD-17B TaxID=1033810 RepID=F7PV11_9MOLU|nr:glutaredoxin family protein [Haloplasma contractile]ERJ11246.1 Glutaredoxin 2 protein [Haloplasma contractile SSD-17B]